MIVSLSADFTLAVEAETDVEEIALRTWAARYEEENKKTDEEQGKTPPLATLLLRFTPRFTYPQQKETFR